MSPRRPKKASQLATALIEHNSDAIALVDEAGTVLYANPAASRILGLPIADIVNSNLFRWVHDADLQTMRANFEKTLAKPRAPIPNAFRMRHNDGTWRHIESVGVNWLDTPGIRGIIINYRDVTESRRSEEALREGEARYRQLTEQATDIIYNCDLDGRFTFVNPTATRLTKFSEQELLGRHFLSLVRGDHRQRVAEFYERQRREYIRSTYFEFPAIAKDGTEVWVGQNVQIVEEQGRAVGVQAIARDITQRLALEDQLRQAQKMEAIGRLAGGVAHDFNNVLTAILGSADLLSMMLDRDDPKWAEADAIKRAADRGAALTRQLLAFSRPQRAAATIVDLAAVVGSMEPMLRRLVLEKIAIRVTVSRSPLPVRADEASLNQIVLNLIINARDAMPEGGTATIDMGEAELGDPLAATLGLMPGRYAGVSVSDTGEGIPPDILRHVFEPFFTTKPADKGTGLGLSIVYGIVKGLGGTIEVQSEPGHGATFTIYVPLVGT
ncbi:MAG: PAS domain-containing sensor histidine kinase [Acidobacteria bacterium]|nr:MAG: PAS domain-containing sensor histidine kinase [Acidobacteriota bacterium]